MFDSVIVDSLFAVVEFCILSSFAIILHSCFTLLVFLLSCDCLCSVSLLQYHGLVCVLSVVVAIPGHAHLLVFSSSSIGCVCRKLGLRYTVEPVLSGHSKEDQK